MIDFLLHVLAPVLVVLGFIAGIEIMKFVDKLFKPKPKK